MKKIAFVIAAMISCSVLVSCGDNTVDDYCQKLNNCGLLEDNNTTLEECKENLEKDYDDMDKHCESDPDKVKDAYNDLLDCMSGMECNDMLSEEALAVECESETRGVAAAMIAYCDYFELSSSDDEARTQGDDDENYDSAE